MIEKQFQDKVKEISNDVIDDYEDNFGELKPIVKTFLKEMMIESAIKGFEEGQRSIIEKAQHHELQASEESKRARKAEAILNKFKDEIIIVINEYHKSQIEMMDKNALKITAQEAKFGITLLQILLNSYKEELIEKVKQLKRSS